VPGRFAAQLLGSVQRVEALSAASKVNVELADEGRDSANPEFGTAATGCVPRGLLPAEQIKLQASANPRLMIPRSQFLLVLVKAKDVGTNWRGSATLPPIGGKTRGTSDRLAHS
jgi:hypothetical protein